MKQIKLNGDRTLNILNPDKVFAVKCPGSRYVFIIYKNVKNNVWTFIDIQNSAYHYFARSTLQELCKFHLTHEYSHELLYEFEDMNELLNCLANGELP